MARYTISLADGSEETSGVASSYAVLDDGALEIRLGGELISRYRPASWVEIHLTTPSLVAHWPPPEIDDILECLHVDLCSHGHCEPLGTSADFGNPVCNDMPTFVAAVLSRVGIGEHSLRSHGALVDLIETRVRAVLSVEPRQR